MPGAPPGTALAAAGLGERAEDLVHLDVLGEEAGGVWPSGMRTSGTTGPDVSISSTLAGQSARTVGLRGAAV